MINRTLILLAIGLLAYIGWDYWRNRSAPAAAPGGPAFAAAKRRFAALETFALGHGLPARGQWRGRQVLRDLDGDGKTDLVAAVRRYDRDEPGEGIWVWRGDGKGNWTPMLEGLRRDMGYGGAEVGDLNGDGRLDIAFSGHDVPPHVFFNALGTDGTGSWIGSSEGIDCKVMCLDVALGDCDGDGNLDLACVGLMPKQGGLYLYRGDGHGGLQRSAEILPRSHYGADVRIVDLDGDGRGEVLAATDTGARVWRVEEQGVVDVGEGIAKPVIGGVELAVVPLEIDGAAGQELIVAGLGYTDYPSVRGYRRVGSQWQPWLRGLPDDLPWFDAATLRTSDSAQKLLVLAGKVGVVVVAVAQDGACAVLGHLPGTRETLNVACGDVDGDGTDEIVHSDFEGVHVARLPGITTVPSGAEARVR